MQVRRCHAIEYFLQAKSASIQPASDSHMLSKEACVLLSLMVLIGNAEALEAVLLGTCSLPLHVLRPLRPQLLQCRQDILIQDLRCHLNQHQLFCKRRAQAIARCCLIATAKMPTAGLDCIVAQGCQGLLALALTGTNEMLQATSFCQLPGLQH